MVTKQIKELEATKAKIVSLERSIAKRLHRELATLHAKYGFDSIGEFTKAAWSAAGLGQARAAARRPARSRGQRRSAGAAPSLPTRPAPA